MSQNTIILNEKQQKALNSFIERKSVFLTGSAGTGKTSIIKYFVKNYSKYRNISITSTTGTSALLIKGVTLHSFLGIGLGNSSVQQMVEKICGYHWLRKRWLKLECLIIDEISMLDPVLFDKLEEVARVVRDNNIVFGGIQLILSGDFCQLPCVGTDKFCFEAKTWNKVIDETIYLTEIIRQHNTDFQNVLNNVRIGNITENVKEILQSRVGKKLTNDFGIKPTKLYCTNRDVDRINNEELDKLAEDDREFFVYNMKVKFYGNISNKNEEFRKFKKYCIAAENLELCVGAQVMLIKNLEMKSGLANGSRGVITEFIGERPSVKFLNGESRVIDFHVWDIVKNGKKILCAKQIPLKVAYAISIHKSQGTSLDLVEMDLSDVFEYGQAYVALSRAINLSGLSIINIDYDRIQAHPKAIEFYNSIS